MKVATFLWKEALALTATWIEIPPVKHFPARKLHLLNNVLAKCEFANTGTLGAQSCLTFQHGYSHNTALSYENKDSLTLRRPLTDCPLTAGWLVWRLDRIEPKDTCFHSRPVAMETQREEPNVGQGCAAGSGWAERQSHVPGQMPGMGKHWPCKERILLVLTACHIPSGPSNTTW